MIRKNVEWLISKLSRQYGVNTVSVLKYFYRVGKPGVHLIEWPTGSGKSLLVSILASLYPITTGLKCFIFCRTYTQINEYLRRLVKISSILDINPKISVLVGKELACPYGDIYDKEMSYIFCKYLGNGIRCTDYRNMLNNKNFTRLKNVFSKANNMCIEEIIEFFLDQGVCPYYSLRKLGQESEIILSTYYYLFNGSLPGKEDVFKYCVFIDEGHNLLDYFIDSNLIRFDKDTLIRLSRELGIDKNILSADIAKKKIDIDSDIHKEYTILFLKKLKERFIGHYFDSFMKDEVSLNSWTGNSERNIINKLISLDLDSVFHIVDEDDSIKLYMSPRFTFFKNFLNSSYSAVFTSATLSPYKFFRHIFKSLGINKKFSIYTEPYLYNLSSSIEVNLYVSRSITSRYVNRTPDSLYFISDFSIKVTRKTKNSTILFVPSLDIKEVIYSIIKESLLMSGITDLEVFIDVDSKDVENFLAAIKPSILVLNQRGRYSEGINTFRVSNKIFNVVIYGLSIQPNDPLKDLLLSEFFRLKSDELFIYGYLLPAMIYFIQSIGRIINERGKLNLYILEKRILKYLNSNITPKWLRKLIEDGKISLIESI